MKNSHLTFTNSAASVSVSALAKNAPGWLLDGEIRQHSHTTLALRRIIIDKLLWFLRQREYPECGVTELRQFFVYLTNGHKEPGGRWGNPRETEPVRPSTVATYHRHLKTLFR